MEDLILFKNLVTQAEQDIDKGTDIGDVPSML